MKAHEQIEQHERLVEGSERGGPKFPIPPAVLVAVLAALLAVVTLLSEYSETHTLIYQGEASEAWANYNTAVSQEHTDADVALMLRGMARGDPRHTQLLAEANRLDNQISAVHQANQRKYRAQATDFEHERDQAEQDHHTYQYAQAGFEVAVIVASIGVLMGAGALVWGAAGFGVLSLLMLLDGLFSVSGFPY